MTNSDSLYTPSIFNEIKSNWNTIIIIYYYYYFENIEITNFIWIILTVSE